MVGATFTIISLIFDDKILYPSPPEQTWAAAIMTLNASFRDSVSQQMGDKPDDCAEEMNPSNIEPIRSMYDLSFCVWVHQGVILSA